MRATGRHSATGLHAATIAKRRARVALGMQHKQLRGGRWRGCASMGGRRPRLRAVPAAQDVGRVLRVVHSHGRAASARRPAAWWHPMNGSCCRAGRDGSGGGHEREGFRVRPTTTCWLIATLATGTSRGASPHCGPHARTLLRPALAREVLAFRPDLRACRVRREVVPCAVAATPRGALGARLTSLPAQRRV